MTRVSRSLALELYSKKRKFCVDDELSFGCVDMTRRSMERLSDIGWNICSIDFFQSSLGIKKKQDENCATELERNIDVRR